MARAQGARAQMALAFETTYGTPPAADSYWRMPFASSSLGSEQPLLSSELLGYGRDPLPPVLDAVTADGDVVVPMDLRFMGIWLKALFGEPASTGTGSARTHTFQSGGWTLPSMAIEVGNPDVPSFRMMSGVVANTLAFSMNRSGLVTGTVSCVAQGETPRAVSVAGELEDLTLRRFSTFNGSIRRAGAQLGNVVSGNINYSNNLDRVETIRSDGLIDGADPGQAALTGEIVVRFADTTLLEQAMNGTPIAMSFGYQITAAERLELTAHAVYLPRPRVQMEGPGGVQATFAWQAARDPGTGRMATVTLQNDVANYNNPT